jgi:hypothetical protein
LLLALGKVNGCIHGEAVEDVEDADKDVEAYSGWE